MTDAYCTWSKQHDTWHMTWHHMTCPLYLLHDPTPHRTAPPFDFDYLTQQQSPHTLATQYILLLFLYPKIISILLETDNFHHTSRTIKPYSTYTQYGTWRCNSLKCCVTSLFVAYLGDFLLLHMQHAWIHIRTLSREILKTYFVNTTEKQMKPYFASIAQRIVLPTCK